LVVPLFAGEVKLGHARRAKSSSSMIG